MSCLHTVRLIHKHSVPHHFLVNELYSPIDETTKARGEFIIVLQHQQAQNGQLLRSLINTLIREYYRLESRDPLDSFELALQKVNESVRLHFDYSHQDALPISGVVGLRIENEIHLSHIGQPLAYLWRNKELISLISEQNEAVGRFGVITSGDITPGDVFIITTPAEQPDLISENKATIFENTENLFDLGRNFARLVRTKGERNVEAILFGQEAGQENVDETFWIDGPLESTQEKAAKIQGRFAQAGRHLWLGTTITANELGKLGVQAFNLATRATRKSASAITAKGTIISKPLTQPAIDSDDIPVRAYWDGKQTPPANSNSKSTTTNKINIKPKLSIPKLSRRMWFMLGGTLLILIVVVQVANSFIHSPQTSSTSTPSVDRTATLNQAEAAIQAGQKAEINSLPNDAITQYSAAVTSLNNLTAKVGADERTKQLSLQANSNLNRLTNTKVLTTPDSTVKLANPAKTVKSLGTSFYALDNQQAIFSINSAATKITNIPTTSPVVDFTTTGKDQSLAIITSDNKMFVVNIATGSLTPANTTSGSWPDARLIDHYGDNLYLVGSTLTRAVPSGANYQTSAFYKGLDTTNVRSVTNDGFFYILDGDKTVARVASQAGRTPITISGVPNTFVPAKFTALLTTQVDSSDYLFLFDSTSKRVLYFTKDGIYKGEYTLPKAYTTCDTNAKQLVCAIDKTIDFFNLK